MKIWTVFGEDCEVVGPPANLVASYLQKDSRQLTVLVRIKKTGEEKCLSVQQKEKLA